MFGETDIIVNLKSKRISRAEYTRRAQDQAIREATKWIPDGKRPQGRPKQRWMGRVRSDLQMLEVINGEELANDRVAWIGEVVVTKGLIICQEK